MKKLFTSLVFAFTFCASFGQSGSESFVVGNNVEARDVGIWYKATIKALGSGDYVGMYLIDRDNDNSSDRWFYAKDVRPVQQVKQFNTSSGPRLGEYSVLSYGSNSNPLRLGHFRLSAGGKYSFYDNGGGLTGSGNYKYNDANKEVVWLSGPFHTNKWGGAFEITREGKTHNVKFTRGTFGSNSTDSR